jgi:hypothetical protein
MNLYVSERARKNAIHKRTGNCFPTTVIMKDAVFSVVGRDSDVSDKRQTNRSVCHLHLLVSYFSFNNVDISCSIEHTKLQCPFCGTVA